MHSRSDIGSVLPELRLSERCQLLVDGWWFLLASPASQLSLNMAEPVVTL